MNRSKAIDIILKLKNKERIEFSDFLNSPYFNRKKKITEMYGIILKNINKLDDPEIKEEIIFRNLFDKDKFSYSSVRNLMSELLQLSEMFLVMNGIKQKTTDDTIYDRLLLKEYNSRFLDKLFNIKSKKISQEYRKRKSDQEYFDFMGRFEGENIAFHLYRSAMRNVPEHLISKTEYDLCYILHLLESDISDLNVNSASFNLNLDKEAMPEFVYCINFISILELIKNTESPLKKEIEIRIRLILLSVNKEDTENYFILKNLIYENIESYRNSEKSNLFIKLKNYCAYRIYNGDKGFYEEKYWLFKKELENVRYNSEGVGPLYVNIYLEIIQKAVLEKEILYAKKIIKEFTCELEESKRDSLYNIANAVLEFSSGNYEKTLWFLSRVETTTMLIKNSSKLLYLKTFYEMNSLETGLSMLDSYIHYLNETKEFTPNRKKILKLNYDILRNLYKIKYTPEKYTDSDLDHLISEIKNSDVYYSDWYNEKISELKNIVKKNK